MIPMVKTMMIILLFFESLTKKKTRTYEMCHDFKNK